MVERIPLKQLDNIHNYLNKHEMIDKKLLEWFIKWTEFDKLTAYKKSVLNIFLLNNFGGKKRTDKLIERWKKIINQEYLPKTKEEWLQIFIGINPVDNIELSEEENRIIDNEIKKLNAFEKKLAEEIKEIKKEFKKGFKVFIEAIEEDMILSNKDYLSVELKDNDLENEALRWEYRYTSLSSQEKVKIRDEYIKRQEECFELS